MAENSSTSTYQVNFPQELLLEAQRVPKPTSDQLRVDAWRNSWLSRLAEMLIGKE
ncbi:MAG: hypothetical protein ACHQIL_02895 [Steroidobacterales bacterium]